MNLNIFLGIMLPFVGTTLGAACVFFMKEKMNDNVQRVLSGFAAGVMTAAGVWSLLIPSINMSESMGKLAFVPAAVGFAIGIVFLLLLDILVPHIHAENGQEEGPKSNLKKTTKQNDKKRERTNKKLRCKNGVISCNLPIQSMKHIRRHD